MEPITMVVGALAAGAAAALKNTANEAVKDAYAGLKTLVVDYWKSKQGGDAVEAEREATVLLENLESDPETFQTPVEKKLSDIGQPPSSDLIQQAKALHELLDKSGFDSGKYNVSVKDSKGVQIGDNNSQTNTF